MAGGPPLLNKPNGTFTAFYGTAASCQKFILDKQDYQHATQRQDGGLWALSAQSGTVVDLTGSNGTIKNGTYRGWE